jgi:hypothetical protein
MWGLSKPHSRTPENGVCARLTRKGENGAAQRVLLAVACTLLAACSTEDRSGSTKDTIAQTHPSSGATGGTTGTGTTGGGVDGSVATGGATGDAKAVADATVYAPHCYELQDNRNCPAYAPYKFYCPANASLHFADPGITCVPSGEHVASGASTGCCTGNQ